MAGRALLIGLLALTPLLPGRVAAQLDLRTYSASGTHQCSGEKAASCVVTGSRYRDCIDATSALRVQDCCATRRDGSRSTGFTINYCIPEGGLGR
ncbi:hypothetical protein [Bradyrhizobium guangzhouense]|nr:hypothetical protein [Bradyrhizobium guangzhouense]QAU46360.1 hypothetical protein XH91_13975 [Bradyrhizobium guangzhouense]